MVVAVTIRAEDGQPAYAEVTVACTRETMTPEPIRSVLKMRPFHPFQIHTMGGGVYPVGDPDLVRVSATTMTPLAAGPDNTTSRVADIDLASVTSLTLDAPTTEAP
jgi:hypothetical protein